jgi:hypothetical protein
MDRLSAADGRYGVLTDRTDGRTSRALVVSSALRVRLTRFVR